MRQKVITSFFAIILFVCCFSLTSCNNTKQVSYTFPAEEKHHDGTWIIWPHHHYWGMEYRVNLDTIWIQMTKALYTGESVNIIAHDSIEKLRIANLLIKESVDTSKLNMYIIESDDLWARDMGPMFAFDAQNKLSILGFKFNGYGNQYKYEKDSKLASAVANLIGVPYIPIPMVLEGGAFEIDGSGTLMATKSSILSESKNPGLTQGQAEAYFKEYFGVTNFIWLDGVSGEDDTDAHIDMIARFHGDDTILTPNYDDFLKLYKAMPKNDYTILKNAKNSKGEPYKIVEIPVTAENVEGIDCVGGYSNFYVGNKVVLVPIFNDINDAKALAIFEEVYKGKTIIPIDVRNLIQHDGAIHCVTQQQPSFY